MFTGTFLYITALWHSCQRAVVYKNVPMNNLGVVYMYSFAIVCAICPINFKLDAHQKSHLAVIDCGACVCVCVCEGGMGF